MPADLTLARAAADVAAGRPALAQRRLTDLSRAMPERLDVREALAAVYRARGDLAQAGRWSYLAEHRDPAEVEAFERAYQGDPVRLMRALRWRGPESLAPTATARETLEALRSRAEAEVGAPLEWEDPRRPEREATWRDAAAVVAFFAVVALVVIGIVSVAVHGVTVVVGWFG